MSQTDILDSRKYFSMELWLIVEQRFSPAILSMSLDRRTLLILVLIVLVSSSSYLAGGILRATSRAQSSSEE
jgi:hypothetical protein